MTCLVLDQRKERGKAEKETEKSSPLHSICDYGLMFDSRRSFSLEYCLIRSPY